jgi:hypothetical protein
MHDDEGRGTRHDDATTLRQIRRHDNNMMIPIPPNGPI